jgi:hypothetical protein
MASAGKTFFAQFTKARSIRPGFYKRKLKDDNQKMFILHLTIETEFFQHVFANPCTM